MTSVYPATGDNNTRTNRSKFRVCYCHR